MKKHVHTKFLALAVMAFTFSSNAQVILEDNFQSYGQKGFTAVAATCVADETTVVGAKYCNCKPDEGTLTVNTAVTVGSGVVTYTLTNSGIQGDMCGTRGGSNATITRVGSDGYIELGKKAEYTTSGLAGSAIISKLPYVGSVTFNVHFTGGNRKASPSPTCRGGYLYKSTDNGANWVLVTATASGASAADAALLIDGPGTTADESFAADVYGATFTATIDAADVMLKFESILEKFRINDLTIDATATGVVDLFVDGSASVSVLGNSLSVESNENGTVQVVGANGTLVGDGSINASEASSFNVSTSGIYFVKLVTDNKVSVKKVLVK